MFTFLEEMSTQFLLPNTTLLAKYGNIHIDSYKDSLFEREGIFFPPFLKFAVVSRKAEFLAGRMLAKRLLYDLGSEETLVIVNKDRSPTWPIGFLGSISHCRHKIICVGRRSKSSHGIGIDIENIIDIDTYSSIKNQIIDSQENELISRLLLPKLLLATIIFSSKESIFKALYPDVRKYFGFDAVRAIKLDISNSLVVFKLTKSLNNKFREGFIIKSKFVFTNNEVVTLVDIGRR